MRKILLYIICFILLCFAIPILFTKGFENEQVISKLENEQIVKGDSNNNPSNTEEYDYKEYKTIKLLHIKDSSIEEIELDDYLYGVVSAEMPASFELEALKAQAVVARTYTIYKIQNSGRKTRRSRYM